MLGKSSKEINYMLKINSKLTTDSQEITNAFNEYFSNIASNITTQLPPTDVTFERYLPQVHANRIEWEPTNEAEIKRIIAKSKATKPGPDNIPMKLIKNNVNTLSPIITYLVNLSLRTGIFPDVHKIGKIVPLFKNKDKYDISNYRPICLLNAMGKILEKIV